MEVTEYWIILGVLALSRKMSLHKCILYWYNNRMRGKTAEAHSSAVTFLRHYGNFVSYILLWVWFFIESVSFNQERSVFFFWSSDCQNFGQRESLKQDLEPLDVTPIILNSLSCAVAHHSIPGPAGGSRPTHGDVGTWPSLMVATEVIWNHEFVSILLTWF